MTTALQPHQHVPAPAPGQIEADDLPPPSDPPPIGQLSDMDGPPPNEPPPPYPVNGGRRSNRAGRSNPNRRSRGAAAQLSSSDSHSSELSSDSTILPPVPPAHQLPVNVDYAPIVQHPHHPQAQSFAVISDDEPTETTPFLSPSPRTRVRSLSNGSMFSSISAAPSFAQTVYSLFQVDDEDGYDFASSSSPRDEHGESGDHRGRSIHRQPSAENGQALMEGRGLGRTRGFWSMWKRYWVVLVRAAYWKSLFHLLVLNFPFALVAWVYLFVFTVTGTTLLVALPLGAILIFFDLLGARLFARGELFLQTKFHFHVPYPRHPIFTRLREATPEDVENGDANEGRERELREERSFYKNTYAMLTDPLSYQALFYFLVIKPAITLLLSLFLVVVIIPAIATVILAPLALRVVRRLGVWQAGVGVEGLAVAVR